ncbi:hypothetical protein J3F84DRAFT_117758 [Trichoderma pleuroticola]
MVGSTANPATPTVVHPCAHMSLAGRTCQWAKSPVTVSHNTTAASDAPENYVPKWPNPGVRREQLSRGGGCASARFAGRARVGLIRLFVCVFFFSFSFPLFSFLFLRSYYGVVDDQKWCRVQVQFTEPSAGTAPCLLDAVFEQQ